MLPSQRMCSIKGLRAIFLGIVFLGILLGAFILPLSLHAQANDTDGEKRFGGDLRFFWSIQAGSQWVWNVQTDASNAKDQSLLESYQNVYPLSPWIALSLYVTNNPYAGLEVEIGYSVWGYGRKSETLPLSRCSRAFGDPLNEPARVCTEDFKTTFHRLSVNIMARYTDFGIPWLYAALGVGIWGSVYTSIEGEKYSRFKIYEYDVYDTQSPDSDDQILKDTAGRDVSIRHLGMIRGSKEIDLDEHYDRIAVPFIIAVGIAPYLTKWNMGLKAEARAWINIMNLESGDAWATLFFGFGFVAGITY